MADQIKTITELPVADIVMRNRRRPVSAAGVAAIRASIEELGVMQDPIHVRKVKHRGGEYVLMVGGHRLTAAREMGWETIPVTCWHCNDDFATLMELDDNLAGAELTALDTAVFLAERKRVYEKMHPGAKATVGADLVAKRWDTTDTMSAVSFANSCAEKFGLTDRHIRRLVAAGERLSSGEIGTLREAEKPVSLKDLMEISKITDDSERANVVKALGAGTAKNASHARKMWKAERGEAPTPLSANDAAYKALVQAWKRAPKAARNRFLEEFGSEIASELHAVPTVSEGDDD